MFDLLQRKYSLFAHEIFIYDFQHRKEVPHKIVDQTENWNVPNKFRTEAFLCNWNYSASVRYASGSAEWKLYFNHTTSN